MSKRIILDDAKPTRKDTEVAEARARATGEAVQCMKRFFHDKPYYKPYPDPKDGTKLLTAIPPDLLISPTTVSIVLDTTELNDAMDIAHEALADLRKKKVPLALSGHLNRDTETELFLGLTRQLRALEIPFQYQGGMMLLYLWLCEGVEFK